MELTQANKDALFISFSAALNQGFGQAYPGWTKWCGVVPSTTAIQSYPISFIQARMREWIGERAIKDLKIERINVRNRDFEDTQGVNRNDLEDDNIGIFPPMFQEMGLAAGNLWPQLGTEALVKNGNWADDKPFFIDATATGANIRKFGKSGKITNLIKGDLTIENYEAGRALMMGFLNASGVGLGLVPDTLMTGPSLEKKAKTILKATLLPVTAGGSESNVWVDSATHELNPFLVGDYANYWFLMCTVRAIKPANVQKRKEGALVRRDQDNLDCVFKNNEYEYGLHYRGASVAGAPQLVIAGMPSN